MLVEQRFDLGGTRRLVGSGDRAVDPLVILGAQGLAQVREGVLEEAHLLREGLEGNLGGSPSRQEGEQDRGHPQPSTSMNP